jgi:hypothetical protein
MKYRHSSGADPDYRETGYQKAVGMISILRRQGVR